MELSRINWSAAAVELADEHHRTKTPRARRALAAVSSLRGRFSDDFTVAAASAVHAVELEPLDPMHRVRDALVRLRFGDRGRALRYADDGRAWIVDEGLARPARVRLGNGKVAGACSGSDGTVLAWTTDGVLHVVGHDGASWQVTDGGVVLALPEPNQIRGSIAIHWSASRGLSVTRGHVAWN